MMKQGTPVNKGADAQDQVRSHGGTLRESDQAEVPTSPELHPAIEYAPIPQEQFEAALARVLTEDDELLRRLA